MHHLEIRTSKQDTPFWECVPLGSWIEALTGQRVKVDAISHQKRHFKVILYTTDAEFEAFRALLQQHFQMA